MAGMISTVILSDSLEECMFISDSSRVTHGKGFYAPVVLSHRAAPIVSTGRKPGQNIYYD